MILKPDDVEKPAILDGRLRSHGGQGDVGHPESSSKKTHSEIFQISLGSLTSISDQSGVVKLLCKIILENSRETRLSLVTAKKGLFGPKVPLLVALEVLGGHRGPDLVSTVTDCSACVGLMVITHFGLILGLFCMVWYVI